MTAEKAAQRAVILYVSAILSILGAGFAQADDPEPEDSLPDRSALPALDSGDLVSTSHRLGSSAEILYEKGYKRDTWNETTFTVTRRIKLYNEEGLRFTQFEVMLRPFEYLEEVRGLLRKPSGEVLEFQELEPLRRETSFSSAWGPEQSLTYAIENALPGDIIEYTYTINTLLGSGLRFNSWYIQDVVPTRKSVYCLDTPTEFMPHQAYIENIDFGLWPDEKETDDRRIRVYTFVNVPSLPLEPMMPPMNYVLGRLIVDYQWQGGSSSSPMGYWLHMGRTQAMRVNRFLERYRGIPETVAGLVTPEMPTSQRIEAVLSWVRQNITNLGQMGDAALTAEEFEEWTSAEHAEEVLREGEGGPLQIAMLTVGMLRESGIKAYLALAADRRKGVLRHTMLDSRQLTHAFVAVRKADNTALFIDPTVPALPAGRVPWYIQGSLALICTERRGVFTRLPVDLAANNRVEILLQLRMNEEGELNGTTEFSFSGQHAISVLEAPRRDDESMLKQEAVRHVESLLGMEVLGAVAFGEVLISEGEEGVKGTGEVKLSLSKSGGEELIDFSSLLALKSDTAEMDQRELPLYFQFPWSLNIRCEIETSGAITAELPESQVLKGEIGELHVHWEIKGKTIIWEKRFAQERVFFQPVEAVRYQQFIESVRALENKQRAQMRYR